MQALSLSLSLGTACCERVGGDERGTTNEGCDLSELLHDGRRGRPASGGWVYKVEGRDQGLVYQPRDSRRLSRVPRDEFIGFIIKRGSQYPASNSPGNLYISRSPRRDLEMRERVYARVCARETSVLRYLL